MSKVLSYLQEPKKMSKALKTRTYIIEAARSFLQKEAIDKFTTNKVADMAGVSIGTVYNHFKNKEEIFIELIQDELRMDLVRYNEYFNQVHESVNILDFFTGLIDLALKHFKENLQLRQLIYQYKNQPVIKEAIFERNREMDLILVDIFSQRTKSKRSEPIFILTTAIRSVFSFYIEFYPEKLQGHEINQELNTLASNYLKESFSN